MPVFQENITGMQTKTCACVIKTAHLLHWVWYYDFTRLKAQTYFVTYYTVFKGLGSQWRLKLLTHLDVIELTHQQLTHIQRMLSTVSHSLMVDP